MVTRQVLLLLVDTADALNAAQQQLEFRKALKQAAEAGGCGSGGRPYEAEVRVCDPWCGWLQFETTGGNRSQ